MGPAPAVAATRLAVRRALIGLDRVLVACSGGPDSVALAAAVAFEAPRAGVTWTLVTVDHGLQPGSAEQARRVEELGRTLNAGAALASTLTIAVHVGHDGGPEGAAREARYAALRRLAAPPPNKSGGGRRGTRVLLGHTRDDQAETVLLGLGRGSGPNSIAGMRRVDGLWIRPFLGLDRATTVAACAVQGLPVWQDPHNDDDRFVRVRLRREVLPLLEDVLHGGVAASLARTADLLRDDLDALDAWAEHAYRSATSLRPSAPSPALSGDQLADLVADRPDRLVDHRAGAGDGVPSEAADRVATHGSRPGEIHVAALAGLHPAIRARVLRRWASDRGAGPLTAAHTAALDALVTAWDGQGPAYVPGGVVTRTRSGTLDFVPNAQQPSQQE